MRTAYAIILEVVLIVGTTAIPAMAIRYLTKEEALRVAIPNAETIRPEQIDLTPAQRQRVHHKSNHPLDTDTLIFYVGKRHDQIDGYAYITDKKGRHRPITFVVGLKLDCSVREVAIMIYREPRGYEVKEKRFLQQYHNKTIQDAIEVRRDIKNISGATISAHSVSAGVREAVAICEEVFKP